MHTNEPRQDPLTDLGYETRDVHYRSLAKVLIWFIVFVIANLVIGFVLLATGIHFNPFGMRLINIDAMSPVYAGKQNLESDKRKIPGEPYPMVQSNLSTRVDIQTMRQEEETRLKGYGYANGEHTRASIPVDRAMEMVAGGQSISTGNSVDAVTKGNTTDQRKDSVPGVTTEAPVSKEIKSIPAPAKK